MEIEGDASDARDTGERGDNVVDEVARGAGGVIAGGVTGAQGMGGQMTGTLGGILTSGATGEDAVAGPADEEYLPPIDTDALGRMAASEGEQDTTGAAESTPDIDNEG